MNAIDQLNAYLQRIESRLRLAAFLRGAAIVAVSALFTTIVLVLITNALAFTPGSLLWARTLLFLALAVALGMGLVLPLLRVTRRRAVRLAESKFPEFQERLLTVADREKANDPFVHLLADDTVKIAQSSQPERLAPTPWILGFLGSASAAALILLWLILAGPGFLGYGTSLLWAGSPRAGTQPFYDIMVQPGDKTVRRKSDQLITARLAGFDTTHVRLFAQYRGTNKWEQVNMTPQSKGNAYEFLFGGLAEQVEYFVEAGAVQSRHYTLKVVDLPSIKRVRVTYHYPKWTGMKDAVEDPGGDLRAVEGTDGEVAIETDRPLSKAVIVTSDDKQIAMKGEGVKLAATVPIQKDGMYHIAAVENGELVRLSEDYFIEARKDEPPTVKIVKPGRDAKASPIEEVGITVEGNDDFGLQQLELKYSVNGGPEKSVSMLNQRGAKTSTGSHTIYLEDYKLTPGDIITVYATARDAMHSVKTDMYFIETQPFEREYSQSQQAGGGGGGGQQDDDEISSRQKEIIAATWNEQKNGPKGAKEAAEDARFLAETQGKLGQQSRSLADRMKSRQLTGSNQEFQSFAQDMEAAAQEMGTAADSLKGQKWGDAMPHEQKALQHILRAEATRRQIQVAFGQRGGGGGGGGGMSRDLDNLFDLELDTEKNQYETGQQQSGSDKRQDEVDKALDRLKQLAKRQQELAEQSQRNQQTFQQRWEQEMLRREAEELKRQMEQLQRGQSSQSQQNQQGQQQGQQSSQSQGQQGQQSSSSSSSNGQQSSSSSQSSQQSARERMSTMRRQQEQAFNDPRLQQAIERLKQATDDMSKSQQGGEQSAAGQRRAAERLQEAQQALGGMRQQQSSEQMQQMVREAEQLSAQQQDFQNRLRQMYGSGTQPGQSNQQGQRLADEKDKMAQDLKNLEHQMSDAAGQMRESQPQTSKKLREAMAESQQSELARRMKDSAEWIRRGSGMSAWMRESTVTQGLEQLKDRLREAQAAAGQEKGQQKAGDPNQSGTERALSRVEQMRNQLQQMAQARQGQRGQQQGQGQQPGQQ
ncbi:MAG: hypothetical protein JO022_01830, partial [Acidobacteriaceae bacterium]|nr:hypothetical protein [Acidobacteriaceae bacterium]